MRPFIVFISSAGLLVGAFVGMIVLQGGLEAVAAGVAVIAVVLVAISLAAIASESDNPPGPRGPRAHPA